MSHKIVEDKIYQYHSGEDKVNVPLPPVQRGTPKSPPSIGGRPAKKQNQGITNSQQVFELQTLLERSSRLHPPKF